MECKKDMCLLEEIFPNSDAVLACDCDCYLTVAEEKVITNYKTKHPELWDKII